MDLKEALIAVKEMGKFFDGFRKIETIIEAASRLGQEIEDLQASKDYAASQVEGLEDRKAKLEGLIVETGERVKAMKADVAAEMRTARKAQEAEKQALSDEIADLKKSKQKALAKHTKAMKKIGAETDEAHEVLESVKKEIEKIKEML